MSADELGGQWVTTISPSNTSCAVFEVTGANWSELTEAAFATCGELMEGYPDHTWRFDLDAEPSTYLMDGSIPSWKARVTMVLVDWDHAHYGRSRTSSTTEPLQSYPKASGYGSR